MEAGDRGSVVVKPRPAWMSSAACSRGGTDAFFPRRGEPTGPGRAVCSTCVVQAECLAYAMAHEDLAGVWGGTTERERRAMRASGERPLSA